ncbi:hypothetical protein ACFFRR_005289 [Megaselia abdita]
MDKMDSGSLILRLEYVKEKLENTKQILEQEASMRTDFESKVKELTKFLTEEKELSAKYKDLSEKLLQQKLDLETCLRRVQKRLNFKQESFSKIMAEKQETQDRLEELKFKMEKSGKNCMKTRI